MSQLGKMLFVLLMCLCFVFANGDCDCTKGFMDYELLKQKASQIPPPTNPVLPRLGNMDTEFVMPGLTFTCTGVITGFLLGVDIRIHGGRTMYPTIGFLTTSADNTSYSLVPGSERQIMLNADDFSTSGLYNYTLPVPLQFHDGQILGAHQFAAGDSRVRLYRHPFVGQSIYRVTVGDDNLYRRTDDGHYIDARILLHPLTG